MSEMVIRRYVEEMKEAWNCFCVNAKNPLFMFDRNYMDYHSERFLDHSLMFYNEGKLVSVFPANESDGSLYSHGGLTYGGLVLDQKAKQHTVNACFDLLIDYMEMNDIKNIYYKTIPHIYHEQPSEEDRYALYRHNAYLLEVSASTVLNLRNPVKMSKGRKAQISRARREGVKIQNLTEKKHFYKFMEIENEVLEHRHHTHALHSADELYMLYGRFPDHIHLFGALLEGELIAGTIIYEYGQVVHTQYMAANETARKMGALDLAVAAVIEKYKDTKLWLDFGISTECGGRYLNEGLISQKEGFGGRTDVYETWMLQAGSGEKG